MIKSITFVGLLAATITGNVEAQTRELIPTSYEVGHFFATPAVDGSNKLRLLVDTGGGGGSGLYVLSEQTIKRLNLPVVSCDLDGTTSLVKPFPFGRTTALPSVAETPCSSVALNIAGYEPTADEDGILGAGYLPHFIWTFDYPAEQLWLEPNGWKPGAGMHATRLGFLKNNSGGKGTGMPRITLTVDGQPLEMLLDTGATASPTAKGKQATGIQTVRGVGVTSYVTTSTINRWLHSHPDWRVVMDGDEFGGYKARIIEVPKVDIAGWMVGPVWFTERPDAAYAISSGGMSSYTDKQIYGSAGANIFSHFSMTLDYPRDTAWFGCVTTCAAFGK